MGLFPSLQILWFSLKLEPGLHTFNVWIPGFGQGSVHDTHCILSECYYLASWLNTLIQRECHYFAWIKTWLSFDLCSVDIWLRMSSLVIWDHIYERFIKANEMILTRQPPQVSLGSGWCQGLLTRRSWVCGAPWPRSRALCPHIYICKNGCTLRGNR